MTQFLRQKYVFILICTALTLISSSVFLIGEKHFSLEGKDMKAFVLNHEQANEENNEAFYRKLINNASDEFLILETDVIIKFASSKLDAEIKHEQSDSKSLKGKNFFSLVNPNDLPFIANAFIIVLDYKQINDNLGPFRLNGNNNDVRLYMASIIPIFDETDEIILMALILRDISNPLGGNDDEKDLSMVQHTELENLISMAK